MTNKPLAPVAKGEDFAAAPYPCTITVTANVTGQHNLSDLRAAYFKAGFDSGSAPAALVVADDGSNSVTLEDIEAGGQIVWIAVVQAAKKTKMTLQIAVTSSSGAAASFTYASVTFAALGDTASVKDAVETA